MTTAIIGTGGLGSVIARLLASGGEAVRLSSADRIRRGSWRRSARPRVAANNRDALKGADAVVLALRFPALKGVIAEIAGPLAGKLVVVPSNPVGLDPQGAVVRLLPAGSPRARR